MKAMLPTVSKKHLFNCCIEYHIPFSLFEKRFGLPKPGRPNSGTAWRGNFYSCGGPKPHYGNWAPFRDRPKTHSGRSVGYPGR